MNNLHILNNCHSKQNIVLLNYSENGVKEVNYNIEFGVNYEQKANKLFAKSHKLKRSINFIEKRMDEVTNYIIAAEENLMFLQNATDDEINNLYFKIFTNQTSLKKSKHKHSFMTFKFGNSLFYVGRNSAVNHELVFGFAKPDDLWFHAQKIPSAHVILRKDTRYDEDDIVFGARLVSYFSKNSNEKRVTVDYTLKKNVKHPKNTPLGFVIYNNFKSITVEPFSENEINNLKSIKL
jgi:predicted ribosome quality control (RQC) complex YloA/Tae2 family protein